MFSRSANQDVNLRASSCQMVLGILVHSLRSAKGTDDPLTPDDA
jgi:hypothetical protein